MSAKDKGAGDEQPLVVPSDLHEQTESPVTEGRNRAALAAEVELDPMSLSGSYCHRCDDGEPVEDGLVVGEVQPGHYLVQFGRGQRIVPLAEMLADKWRFYDTKDDRTLAWAEHLAREATE